MILKAILNDQMFELNIPEEFILQSEGFFEKMDHDMDQGRQMGRQWVSNPHRMQRCQLAADQLLHALEAGNDNLGRMMAGYILSRMPEAEAVEFNLGGEVEDHNIRLSPSRGGLSFSTVDKPRQPVGEKSEEDPGKTAAEKQAEQEIGAVFKMGRQFKFTMLDPASGEWLTTPPIATREQAEIMRRQAVEQRCNEILARP